MSFDLSTLEYTGSTYNGCRVQRVKNSSLRSDPGYATIYTKADAKRDLENVIYQGSQVDIVSVGKGYVEFVITNDYTTEPGSSIYIPKLGITIRTPTSQTLYDSGGLSAGVEIVSVEDHSPGHDAGLQPQSIITAVGGTSVSDPDDVVDIMATVAVDDDVDVTVWSIVTGTTDTLTLTAGDDDYVWTVPVITSTPTLTGEVDSLWSYTIVATGNPTPTINVSNMPDWMTYVSATQFLSGTPVSGDEGVTGTITVEAVNGEGTDTQDFALTIASGVFDTFQPYTTDSPDYEVGPGKTYDTQANGLAAAVAAAETAGTGTYRIECTGIADGDRGGVDDPYYNQDIDLTGMMGGITVNIVFLGDPADSRITGNSSIYVQNITAEMNVYGMDWRSSDTVNYQIHGFSGPPVINFYRCKFTITSSRTTIVYAQTAIIRFYGCIITASSAANQFMYAGGNVEKVIKNCIVDCENITGTGHCLYNNSTLADNFIIYNSAFIPRFGVAACTGPRGYSGDYNASTDTTTPGANSHDNITWANWYNASYVPQNANAKTGGDTGNAADYDYYGNDLSALANVPIGAIYAE